MSTLLPGSEAGRQQHGGEAVADADVPVSVLIPNKTDGVLELDLQGSSSLQFSLLPGDNTVQVTLGPYTYVAKACQGQVTSDSMEFTDGRERGWSCE